MLALAQSQKQPLVLLTRPQGKNERLQNMLSNAGIQSLVSPALAVEALPVACDTLPKPGQVDLLVFVSGQAWHFYYKALQSCGYPEALLAQSTVATVGVSSARALAESGLFSPQRILCPPLAQPQDSESLWRLLLPRLTEFKSVAIIRGETGRDWLGDQFESVGVKLKRFALYRRRPLVWTRSEARKIQQAASSSQTLLFVITSTESMSALFDNIHRHQLANVLDDASFLLIHQRLADRLAVMLKGFSGKVDAARVLLAPPTDGAMFAKISSHIHFLRSSA